ncbi:hypothetical protein LCGC14_1941170, partial [marine sediment metagenome]
GVSIPPPSCSPSWWMLTEEILKTFFNHIPEDYNLPTDMILKGPNQKPEEVFETFAIILEKRLNKVFEVLDVAEPNAVHIILARLAKAGILKACFTTNFDLYFEHALNKEGVDYELLVENLDYEKSEASNKFLLCKIHGTIERPNTIISVASAYKSAKGFSAPKATVFESMLAKYPCVFLGYSGYDFSHVNYRRFWENVGPRVKRIIWNKRPGEESGPFLKDIFHTCADVFEFSEAEFPDDLYDALLKSTDINFSITGINSQFDEKAEVYYNRAKDKRLSYFTKWVKNFPEAHVLGLVMTESQKFSNRFREFIKKSQEDTLETGAITYDFTTNMEKLTQKYQHQELSAQEYQKELIALQMENQMRGFNKKYKNSIKAMMEQNQFPGITDNNSNINTFLGFLKTLSRWFEADKAADIAADYAYKVNSLVKQNTEEARVETLLLYMEINILHPNETLWKQFALQMHEVMDERISGKIDGDKFQAKLMEIQSKASDQQMGMSIDYEYLLDKQINTTLNSENDDYFKDQCEAVVLTIIQLAPVIYKKYYSSKEYLNLVYGLTQEGKITKDSLDFFNNMLQKRFIPLLERAEGTKTNVKLLFEIMFLRLWIIGIQWLDPNGLKEYTRLWDSGEYPKHYSHNSIFRYLREKVDIWLEHAFQTLEPRFVQKLCGDLLVLAEIGDDFELAKKATLKSLELSDGMVNEATPDGVPGCLGGFYERQGDKENALKYYNLGLDAIRLTIPPIWADVIIYRATKLLSEKNEKRKALEIILKFHPAFKGNASSIHMPA